MTAARSSGERTRFGVSRGPALPEPSSGIHREAALLAEPGVRPKAVDPAPAEACVPARQVSLIVTTFNHPRLLQNTLLGYARQSMLDFELIVADDGSGPETAAVIERLAKTLPYPLLHVWQPDNGFHKARAVNRAVLRSRGAYLIFSDGDCIPASTFVEDHVCAAQRGRYVVGGFVRLSEAQSDLLTEAAVVTGSFERWVPLRQRVDLAFTHLKSQLYIATSKPRKPKFYGLNFSVHRDTFYAVNGFDETYHNCGKEDSDLRNRMQLAGLLGKSLWYRAGVFHQYHPAHDTRRGWSGVFAYYHRPDLAPVAPIGLRELERQLLAGGEPEGEGTP
jgi:glycosyltransferase involved in cell wall biosynthesis